MIQAKIHLLDEGIDYPSYAHPRDSGFDIRSTISMSLEPFERATIPCGFAIAVPEGFGGFVLPRSGLASKHGISIVNSPGLVDSGYRGEVKVVLINMDSKQTFEIQRGDRIAQMVLIATPIVELIRSNKLDDTLRGASGFGSSGL